MANLDSRVRQATSVPAFSEGLIHRGRLVDVLENQITSSLIVIAAPAGYGKTTLLADLGSHSSIPIVWNKVSSGDDDPIRLSQLLTASLGSKFRRIKKKAKTNFHSDVTPDSLANTLSNLVDEYINTPFYLIFDDVHNVARSDSFTKFLDRLLENSPAGLTVIAAGREVPQVSLAKLMATGKLIGLGPHDLAFTTSEILELSKKEPGEELDIAKAEAVRAETNGWPTGISLSRSFSSSDLEVTLGESAPMVYEYLAAVVMNLLGDETRNFLFDSSVLPYMTVQSCNRVLGIENSAEYLAEALSSNLFLTATYEEPRIYEFHPQFRSFLADTAKVRNPKRHEDLVRKAAAHFAQNDDIEAAVDLFFSAEAWLEAATIADLNAQKIFGTGHYHTLDMWESIFRQNSEIIPRVNIYLAASQIERAQYDDALSSISRAFEQLGNDSPILVRAEGLIIRGFLHLHDENFEKSNSDALEALSLIEQDGDQRLWGRAKRVLALSNYSTGQFEKAILLINESIDAFIDISENSELAKAYSDLSLIQSARGSSFEAHRASLDAHKIVKELGSPLQLSISLNNLAVDAYLAGNFEDALRLFSNSLENARFAGSPYREGMAIVGKADIFLDLMMGSVAGELYEEALQIGAETNNHFLLEYGCLQTAVLHRRNGNLQIANQWLNRSAEFARSSKDSSAYLLQQAALLQIQDSGEGAEILEIIMQNESADSIVRTLASYFHVRSSVLSDNSEREDELEKFLELVGVLGTEQIISGELAADAHFLDQITNLLSENSIIENIEFRISEMNNLRKTHSAKSEPEPGVDGLSVISMGKYEATFGGVPLDGLKKQQREILVYFVDRRILEKSRLAEEYWPDLPEGKQTANMHMGIYGLRKSLGKESIILDGSNYELNSSLEVRFDVHAFEHAAKIANRLLPGDPRAYFAFSEAKNAYGGEFLPGNKSEWVIEKRRFLEQLFLDVLNTYAGLAIERSELNIAIETLRAGLDIDPYRDDLNYQFINSLGIVGRRSDLISHYQEYSRLLRTDLGIVPSEKVRDLYTKLIS